MGKEIIVIGGGFSGLSAACYLQQKGYKVTVLEKNEQLGGRARTFEAQGFLFDMGPSWYWMPDVFESFFKDFNHKPEDFYELVRLDPSYQVVFEGKETWEIPAGAQAVGALLESKEAGAAAALSAFLKQAAYKYEVGMQQLVQKPSESIFEFTNAAVLKGMLHIDILTNMKSHVGKYFKNKHIQALMEFPVLFLGAMPEKIPALYSLMNYADIQLGTWYPMGGMHKIIKAMAKVAQQLGVNLVTATEVLHLHVNQNTVTTVHTNNGMYEAQYVVSSADYHHTDQQLLPKDKSNYTGSYWDSRVLAPSCLLYYVGLNTKIPGLKHHNLFFDTDFSLHGSEIYNNPKWPSDPLFYACCPSKTDASVAPEGYENLFLLIPVAPGMKDDTPEVRKHYFNIIINRLTAYCDFPIAEHIVYCRDYAHSNFIADYHSFKGNAYGLANTLMQTAILKPQLRHKKLKNMFYTGQLTVPGPGIPPSIISGKIVAQMIEKTDSKF